jgi:hypothetical protein
VLARSEYIAPSLPKLVQEEAEFYDNHFWNLKPKEENLEELIKDY